MTAGKLRLPGVRAGRNKQDNPIETGGTSAYRGSAAGFVDMFAHVSQVPLAAPCYVLLWDFSAFAFARMSQPDIVKTDKGIR